MAVVAVFQHPSFTRAQYEESVRRLTGGHERVEKASDWPVEGLLVHVAGEGPNGFRVVDVWESEEAFQRFGEVIMPIAKALGIEAQPEVYPVHTLVSV
jgi:hypothetical protein